MRNRQECFNQKMAAVSPEIVSEVQLSVDIIARLDAILKQKNMTQKDLARKMGRSEMDESYAELIIEKNRAGEVAVIQLNFNGSLTKFTEESQSLASYATQPIPSSANNPSPVDISHTPGYTPHDFENEEGF